jgi:hypothetical protein
MIVGQSSEFSKGAERDAGGARVQSCCGGGSYGRRLRL